MTDIVERAKRFQDHLRDTNSQEAEELVGELIAEVEKLRDMVARLGYQEKTLTEEVEKLTKELDEWKGKYNLFHLPGGKIEELEAENAELKKENERVLFANREGIDWTESAREEIKDLKAKLVDTKALLVESESQLKESESDKNLISCQRCGAAGFIDSGVGDDKICPDCDGEGAVDQGEIERLRGENKSLKEHAKQIADAVYMKTIKELEAENAELLKRPGRKFFDEICSGYDKEITSLKAQLADKTGTVDKLAEMLREREGNMDGLVQKLRKQLYESKKKVVVKSHQKAIEEIIADIGSGKLFVEDFGRSLIDRALYALRHL